MGKTRSRPLGGVGALPTCDSNFKPGLVLAQEGGPKTGWSGLRLHPASVLS